MEKSPARKIFEQRISDLCYYFARFGEVAEWSNVPDSKSGVLQGTVGSNPTLSAIRIKHLAKLTRFGFLLSGFHVATV